MNELDKPFRSVDGGFKSDVEKLRLIHGLLPRKTTKSMGYDVVRSYK